MLPTKPLSQRLVTDVTGFKSIYIYYMVIRVKLVVVSAGNDALMADLLFQAVSVSLFR